MTPIFNFNISVIIPVYNAEQYIRRAVTSVLDQEEVTEILIVEDGSQDNSQEICLQLAASDKRIKLLQHPGKKNRGVSASRNLGIKRATNEFIAFLDADDYYLAGRFKLSLERLKREKEIDGIYEPIAMHNNNTEIRLIGTYDWIDPVELFEQLSPVGEYIWFHADGLTLRKSVFEEVSYFDENLQTNEDTLLWLQFAANKKLVCGNICQPVAMSERLDSGLSSNTELVLKNQIIMLMQLFKFLKRKSNHRRRELVLNRLLFYVTQEPYRQNFQRLNLYALIVKIIFIDINFVLFKSKSFRKFAGDVIKYNRFKVHYENKS